MAIVKIITRAPVILLVVSSLVACGNQTPGKTSRSAIAVENEPQGDHDTASDPKPRSQGGKQSNSEEKILSEHSDDLVGSPAWTHSAIQDAEGDLDPPFAPRFADLISAKVSRRGMTLRFSMTFAADFPAEFGENQNFIVGIGVGREEVGQGKSDAAVIAQGTRSGWKAAVQSDRGKFEINEGFRVKKRSLIWTVPVRMVQAPPRFFWGASVRWLDFGASGESAAQASDRAPEKGPARYEG
jgi:hypothetical protein